MKAKKFGDVIREGGWSFGGFCDALLKPLKNTRRSTSSPRRRCSPLCLTVLEDRTTPATHFSVSAPSSATAGVSFAYTVAALDDSNNPDPSYNGIVHFSSSDPQAVLPADSTLTNGVGTFAARFWTAGIRTLTATDTLTSFITGTSGPISVTELADLRVAVADSPDPVAAGDTLTYTITLTSDGPSNSRQIQLTDVLPAGTTFVSFSTPGFPWTASTPPVGGTGAVVVTPVTPFAGLVAGASAIFTLVVRVNPNMNGAIITNTASVLSGPLGAPDPNSANNSDTASTHVVTRADIGVSITDSPDPVAPGGILTYTITLTNDGPSNSLFVTLVDNIPVGTRFESLTAPPGWTGSNPPDPGYGINYSGRIEAGASLDFILAVRVDSGLAPGSGIFNFALIGTARGTDPNPANNNFGLGTTVGDDDPNPPAILLGGSSGNESHGLPQSFDWVITDESGLSELNVRITLDRGAGPETIFTATNPADSTGNFSLDSFGLGTFRIEVSATDADQDSPGDTLSASASREVTVTNAAPDSVNLSGNSLNESGQPVIVGILSGTDPDGEPLAFALADSAGSRFEIVDGRLQVAPGAVFDFETEPELTIRVRATDQFGSSLEVPCVIHVSNIVEAPVLTIDGPADGVRGQERTFTLTTQADATASLEFRYHIDWNGDGTVDQIVTGPDSVEVPHVYTRKGVYTVAARAEDSNSLFSDTAQHTIAIRVAVVQDDPLAPGERVLVVGGTDSRDVITFAQSGGVAGPVRATFNHFGLGPFTGVNRIMTLGRGGPDMLVAGRDVAVPVELLGGGGNDTLGGGLGSDMLLGGRGNDHLAGDFGRDILVGGTGFDILSGSNGADLLLAGNYLAPKFTSRRRDLRTVQEEWTAEKPYRERVSALLPLLASRIDDDATQDILIGGTQRDWFIARRTGPTRDLILDPSSDEIVTDLR